MYSKSSSFSSAGNPEGLGSSSPSSSSSFSLADLTFKNLAGMAFFGQRHHRRCFLTSHCSCFSFGILGSLLFFLLLSFSLGVACSFLDPPFRIQPSPSVSHSSGCHAHSICSRHGHHSTPLGH